MKIKCLLPLLGILIPLGPLNGTGFGVSGVLAGETDPSQEHLGNIIDGRTYINIHTGAHGGGEIRGQIQP